MVRSGGAWVRAVGSPRRFLPRRVRDSSGRLPPLRRGGGRGCRLAGDLPRTQCLGSRDGGGSSGDALRPAMTSRQGLPQWSPAVVFRIAAARAMF